MQKKSHFFYGQFSLVGNPDVKQMKAGGKRGNYQIIRLSTFVLMGLIEQYLDHLLPRKKQ